MVASKDEEAVMSWQEQVVAKHRSTLSDTPAPLLRKWLRDENLIPELREMFQQELERRPRGKT
jgi:hypothetical protein